MVKTEPQVKLVILVTMVSLERMVQTVNQVHLVRPELRATKENQVHQANRVWTEMTVKLVFLENKVLKVLLEPLVPSVNVD